MGTIFNIKSSLVDWAVKNLPTMWETQVQSLDGEDSSPGEGNGNLTPVSCWRSHGEMSLLGNSPWGCKELDTSESQTITYNGKESEKEYV